MSATRLVREAAARSQAVAAILGARLLLVVARRRALRWATTRERAHRGPNRTGAIGGDGLSVAVSAIAHVGGVVRASCLEQALALVLVMAAWARRGRLVIGVRRAGPLLEAHAWVECDGAIVLGGGAPLEGLARLPAARKAASPSWYS